MAILRGDTSIRGGVREGAVGDYTGPKEKVSMDEFTKRMMAFGPKGPPPGFDPRSFDVMERPPRKTVRGAGSTDEDVYGGLPGFGEPFDDYDEPYDDFAMMPEPYEPSTPEGMSYHADPYSGEMILMPDTTVGSGKMFSRGKLLESDRSPKSRFLLDPKYYS